MKKKKKKNYSIPHSDSSPLMMNYTLKRWQDSLVQYIHNKLHEMQFLVCKTLCSYGKNRKDGHGMLTHSYLLASLVVLMVKIGMIRWS